MKALYTQTCELLLQDLTDLINTNDSIEKIDDLSNALCWLCSNYNNCISKEFQSVLVNHIESFRIRPDYKLNFVYKISGMICALNSLSQKETYMDEALLLLSHHNSSMRISALGSIFCSVGRFCISHDYIVYAVEQNLINSYGLYDALVLFLVLVYVQNPSSDFIDMLNFRNPVIYERTMKILDNYSSSSLSYVHEVLRMAKVRAVDYCCRVVLKEYNANHMFEYDIAKVVLVENKFVRAGLNDTNIAEIKKEITDRFLDER